VVDASNAVNASNVFNASNEYNNTQRVTTASIPSLINTQLMAARISLSAVENDDVTFVRGSVQYAAVGAVLIYNQLCDSPLHRELQLTYCPRRCSSRPAPSKLRRILSLPWSSPR